MSISRLATTQAIPNPIHQRTSTTVLIAIRQGLVSEGIETLARRAGYRMESTIGAMDPAENAIRFDPETILVCDLALLSEMIKEKELADIWKPAKIVVITTVSQIRQHLMVPIKKIKGFVSLNARFNVLAAAIDHVALGESFVDPRLQQVLVERKDCNGQKLTPRQLQILQLVAAGHSSRRIALDLGISPSTVENHRARMMHKFGVNSSMELLRIALQNELL